MSTINADLQRGVYSLLNNAISLDGGTTFLPIYDAVPQDADAESTPEFVTIGDTIITPFDTKLGYSQDNTRATVTIHNWTKDYEGRLRVKQIMDAVKTVMNRGNLVVPNYTLILIRALDAQTVRDPDGNTYHGIQTFDIILNAT